MILNDTKYKIHCCLTQTALLLVMGRVSNVGYQAGSGIRNTRKNSIGYPTHHYLLLYYTKKHSGMLLTRMRTKDLYTTI